MKLAVVILAVIGSALAASIDNEVVIPPFRSMVVDPIGEVHQKSDPALRIINGIEVAPHSIPYQVYLVGSEKGSSWSCGGSLITERYVLTAAHCLDGATSVKITLGAHNLRQPSPGQVVISGENWKIHEFYDPNLINNDIGYVRLSTPAPLSNTIGLSRLPTYSDVGANLVDRDARVSGWGLTSGSGSTSDVLRAVNNSIISNAVCNDIFGIVTPKEVCLSGSGGRTACNGDSGGPLVLDNTQIGIVSYGTMGCLSDYPAAFTRVSEFLDWIQANTDYVV